MELLLTVLLLTALSEVNSFCRTKCDHIVCYYVRNVYSMPLPEHMPADLCTHIVISRYSVTSTYELDTLVTAYLRDPYTELYKLKAKNKDLKILLAIQNEDTFDVFVNMYTSTWRRKAFIQKLIPLLRYLHIDGVKIDEQLRTGGNKTEFANFISDIAREFRNEDRLPEHKPLILTVGIPTNITFLEEYYDIPRISEHADMLDLASYNFPVPTVTENPQCHSPLINKNASSTQSIEYLTKYVVSKGANWLKMNVGLSTKPYVYESEGGGPFHMTELHHLSTFCTYGKRHDNATVMYPENSLLMEVFSGNGPLAPRTRVILDEGQNLREKVNYTLQHGYSGVVVMGLNYDQEANGFCSDDGAYPLQRAIKSACGL